MKKFIIGIICVLFISSMIVAYDFVGLKKCKMCHKGEKKGLIFEKWQKGPHAGALETLKAKGEDKNPKCLGCHTTGYMKGGYEVGSEKAALFEGVGCESCHGAGSAYKKKSIMEDHDASVANGMIVISEKVCKECHNEKSPDFKGFDYAKYTEKIDHTIKK